MLRIILGQMEVIPGRPDLNAENMLRMIGEASRGASMIVFPALGLSGSHVGSNWEQQSFLRDCQEYGRRIIRASENICVVFGNVALAGDGRLFDAVFVAHQGGLLTPVGSPYPFWLRQLDDARYFTGLRRLATERGQTPEDLQGEVVLRFDGAPVSLGRLAVGGEWPESETAGRERAGLIQGGTAGAINLTPANLAAEPEQWETSANSTPIHPKDEGARVRRGALGQPTVFMAPPSARLLVYIASEPFVAGRGRVIKETLAAEAAKRGASLIYVNNTGIQNKGKTVYIYDGGSVVFNGRGEKLFRLPAFASGIVHSPIEMAEGTGPALGSKRPQTLSLSPEGREDSIGEIFGALRYGLKKFLAQIGVERVVIGASGGIDSAVNAALFGKVLQPEQLLLVNMPSRFNSRITRDSAAELAANLGCRYTVMPIQESVEYTVRQIEEGILTSSGPIEPTGLTVSQATAENIQARDRSARVLAGLAAAFGGGFTCNANKSETTIGYSTLYGDLSGFLAPLADLWKDQVYQLADYLNRQVYQREVIPQKSIEIRPSAELSPAQAVEEGKGDPLHYPYHDYLFRAFMETPVRATPEDLLEWRLQGCLEENIGCAPGLAGELFPAPEDFIADLERWWLLFTGLAVAKRIQSPPILSVSRRAYGADYQEAQNTPYFSARYQEMKARLLNDLR